MTYVSVVSASGSRHGIGHLKRANRLALSLALRASVRVERRDLNADADQKALIRALDVKADVLVLDVPPTLWGAPLGQAIHRLRDRGTHIVGIDGPVGGVDLLIVPSFYVNSEIVDCYKSGAQYVRWGWEYLIIDERRHPTLRLNDAPVLVVTGGSDTEQLASYLPGLLDESLTRGQKITWIVGPHADQPQLPVNRRLAWTVEEGRDDLRPLMSSAGYALSVFGVSTLELLHHGVPSVVFSPYGDRDLAHLDCLSGEGAALVALDAHEAVLKLAALVSDRSVADELANCALRLASQTGTERVVDEILGLM